MSYTLDESKKKQLDDAVKKMGYSDYADAYNAIAKTNGLPTITSSDSGATYNQYTAIMKEASKMGAYDRAYQQGDIYKNRTTPADTTYSTLVDNADAYKNSAYANAELLKNASYAQALKAREEAEALAEIQRKRGVVDASTMAAQQRATYGANAEALGRSGLNVSGYSDYINSQAYASGMAARQNANAQATDMKRQATYQEALARLEADKTYSQTKAEADKTYYGMLNEIESAKIADAQAQEQQKQTNYGKLIDAIVNSNGSIDKDTVALYASALGITDPSQIKEAESFATKYAGSTPKTLTEAETQKISNAYDVAIQNGDYITAGDKYIEGTHYDATDEEKKTYLATFIVDNITNVDDSQWRAIGEKIKKGDYGTKGGERIKEAFTNTEYVASADKLDEKSLKSIIESGLLTDEAQSKLDVMYENKFGENDTKQTSIYNSDVFAKYAGSNNPDSKQSKYTEAIIDMVKNGDIEEGQYVMANYGDTASGKSLYKYLGNGKFEQVKEYHSGANLKDIVKLPDGYHWMKDSYTGKYIVAKDKK